MATIRYKQTPAGKTQIESKDDARKRGVKSPDRAEAVMLAYAHPHETGVRSAETAHHLMAAGSLPGKESRPEGQRASEDDLQMPMRST